MKIWPRQQSKGLERNHKDTKTVAVHKEHRAAKEDIFQLCWKPRRVTDCDI